VESLPIREEVARLADARDFQRAFREVWELPYVVIPTPGGKSHA